MGITVKNITGQDIIDAIKLFHCENKHLGKIEYGDGCDLDLYFDDTEKELDEKDEYGEPIMLYYDFVIHVDDKTSKIETWRSDKC